MNYIFIGGTYRGLKLLRNLLKNGMPPDYMVILKEDDHELVKCSADLCNLAQQNGISFSVKKKLGKADIEIIKEKTRDFAIVCGWRTIIPLELGNYFKLGMIAAHDSLLPAYRGFAPINWAIINGETETGVTLFKITDGEVDSGPIYIQKKVKINKNEYAQIVYEKITQATILAFDELIQRYKKGTLKKREQNEKKATYTCKRSPDDGLINWKQSSGIVLNFIMALAPPYPGAFCYFNNIKYIITKARIGSNNDKVFIGNIPGRVIKIFGEGIEVLCLSGTIEILEWINTENMVEENPSSVVKSITVSLK